MFRRTHPRSLRAALLATATMITLLGGLAIPAVAGAHAKKHKAAALTQAAVIRLIKKYAKPGPKYTVASNSGLTLQGNALMVDPGLFGACPSLQALFSLSPTGSHGCGYPVQGDVESGFYNTDPNSPIPAPGGALGLVDQVTIASATAAAPTTATYYLNASVEIDGLVGTPTVVCYLGDHGNTFQSDAVTVNGYGEMDIQAEHTLPPGDEVDVACIITSGGSSARAQATVVAIPITQTIGTP